MPSYLITGASRGIGLGFVTELLKDNNNLVIATARNTGATGLQDLNAKHTDGRLHLIDLDVTKPESVHHAAEVASKLLPGGLDYLISNAGVNPQPLASFENANIDEIKFELEFNILSVIYLFREFLPLVRKSEIKKILVLTSNLGSIERAYSMPGLANTYSVGKAGLNMLIRKWSATLKNDGITTILVHPGWVGETEVGNGISPWMEKYAPQYPKLSTETAVTDVLKTFQDAKEDDNGQLFNHDGSEIPW